MSTKRKFNNFFSIQNINNVQKNKFYRRYRLGCVKLTIKNKEKIKFYIKKQEEKLEREFLEKKKILDELKEFRKNKKYILTVYITTYNHERTIEKAIESVLNQDTHYEYLIKILDDCSKDKTGTICFEYAKRYPEKIEYVPQKKNTQGKQISAAFRTITSDYYAFLDGDDYWCDKNKIQKALDYLSSNKDVVMFVHDVGLRYGSRIRSLVHDINKIDYNYINPFGFENIIDSHMSGRIYRNIIDFKKEFVKVRKRDGILNELFLSKGKAYFEDKIMSVYTKDTGAVWNSLSERQRQFSRIYRVYTSCKTLNYKYNDLFIKNYNYKLLYVLNKVFGKKNAWKIFIIYMRAMYELKEIKLLHEKFNEIELGHDNFSKNEMDLVVSIAEEMK